MKINQKLSFYYRLMVIKITLNSDNKENNDKKTLEALKQ